MAGWLESTTGIPSRGRSTGRNACAWMAKSKSTCAVSALAQQPPHFWDVTKDWNAVGVSSKSVMNGTNVVHRGIPGSSKDTKRLAGTQRRARKAPAPAANVVALPVQAAA